MRVPIPGVRDHVQCDGVELVAGARDCCARAAIQSHAADLSVGRRSARINKPRRSTQAKAEWERLT